MNFLDTYVRALHWRRVFLVPKTALLGQKITPQHHLS